MHTSEESCLKTRFGTRERPAFGGIPQLVNQHLDHYVSQLRPELAAVNTPLEQDQAKRSQQLPNTSKGDIVRATGEQQHEHTTTNTSMKNAKGMTTTQEKSKGDPSFQTS